MLSKRCDHISQYLFSNNNTFFPHKKTDTTTLFPDPILCIHSMKKKCFFCRLSQNNERVSPSSLRTFKENAPHLFYARIFYSNLQQLSDYFYFFKRPNNNYGSVPQESVSEGLWDTNQYMGTGVLLWLGAFCSLIYGIIASNDPLLVTPCLS